MNVYQKGQKTRVSLDYPLDFIVIGAGIAGLTCAHKIIQAHPKQTIKIFESDSEAGGRIRTSASKDFQIEKGAARFSENHKYLLALIDEFGLTDQMLEIPNAKSFVYKNKSITYDLQGKLQDILKQGSKIDKKVLQKITLFQLCALLYGSEEATKIQELFGYDAEFIRLNAHAALTMFENDLFGDDQYYVLKCGLSELIRRLEASLIESGVKIEYGSEVTEMDHRRVTYRKGGTTHKISGLKIICTMPYLSLRKLQVFRDNPDIHAVKPIALCRICAKYPLVNGKVWFHDLQKTTTDNYLRYIIPMDASQGIVMYYSDLYSADMWRNWSNVSDDVLVEAIHRELALLYPDKKIPKPTKIQTCHWKAGVHLWRPNFDFQKVGKRLLKPFPEKDIYLAGECYSSKQDWMEGSLITSNKCLAMLGIKPKKTHKKSHKKSQ